MSIFNGVFLKFDSQSFLNSSLLFMAGFPDPSQAMFAATQFLVKVRNLHSGQSIQVIGTRTEGVDVIVMQDARPLPAPVPVDSAPFRADHFLNSPNLQAFTLPPAQEVSASSDHISSESGQTVTTKKSQAKRGKNE